MGLMFFIFNFLCTWFAISMFLCCCVELIYDQLEDVGAMRGGHRAEVRVELRRQRVCGKLVAWVKFGTPRFISCLATTSGLSLLILHFDVW